VTPLLFVLLAANPYLAEGKAQYDALDYEKCVARLEQAARWKDSTKEEQRDVELYSGLCHFNMGQKSAAVEHFRTALRIDQYAGLPPYSSPKAEDLFLKVKEALLHPEVPFDDTDLPDDAPTKVSLAPADASAATAPPPAQWKQHAAPIALGAVATAAVLAGIGLGLQAKALEAQANQAMFESDFKRLGGAAQGNAVAANVAFGIAATAAVSAGVVYLLGSR